MATILDEMQDDLDQPGVLIDPETGLEVPNMPVVGPVVRGIDAGLQAAANATTEIAQPGDIYDPTNVQVDVPPLSAARTGRGSYSIGGAEPETVEGQIAQANAENPAISPEAALVNPNMPSSPYDTGFRLPTAGTSESVINKEVDLGSQTVSSKTKTAEAAQALQDAKLAEQAVGAGARQEISGVQEANAVAAERAAQAAGANETYQTAIAKVAADEKFELEQKMKDLDAAVERLANTPREDFWGSKSEGQKMAAALSIGLGSFGQALTGSGRNVGLTILNSKIDQFNRAQDEKFDREVKKIEGMRANMATKRELFKLAREEALIKKEAALAKIDKELAVRASSAKTQQQVGQIMQQSSKIQADLANARAQRESEYAAQISQTTKQRTVETMKKMGLYREDGKDLTEADVENFEYYNRAAVAFNEIEAIGGVERELDIAQRPAYQKFITALQADTEAFREANLLGTNIGKVWAGLNQMAAYQELKAVDPEAARYVEAFEPMLVSRLRKDTGAAIAQGEYWKTLSEMFPITSANKNDILTKNNRRKEMLQAQFNTLGVRVAPPKE